ncbi:MAG: hypothetical protein JWM11_7522 [Planctomycetaceae bacterium]|nr:hypothetical protein [Planctomycetaceae bacterium]
MSRVNSVKHEFQYGLTTPERNGVPLGAQFLRQPNPSGTPGRIEATPRQTAFEKLCHNAAGKEGPQSIATKRM